MKEKSRFQGLDVHAETIAVAVAEQEGEVRSLGTIPNRAESIRKLIKKLGPASKLRACYEAGPTGYVVYWQLAELGVECEVVAPTLVPVTPSRFHSNVRSWTVPNIGLARNRNRVFAFVCAILCGSSWCPSASAQAAPAPPPNALNRLLALHLPRLEGTIPVYYSEGLKTIALRDQAEITACSSWYSSQLHVSVPATLAVLNAADWNRVGHLAGYPMAEAFPEEGNVIIMPDSFATFPGQNTHADLNKKLDFIALHETGHLYQRAIHLPGPDLFMQEFVATMLATAYSLAHRPELLSDTLNYRTGTKQRYTSFEDMDLIYDGVGFDNYDCLQVETVRLALYLVKGQDLASLVKRMQAAFPPGQPMSNSQVFSTLNAIRPGMLTAAGSLANPTTLKLITPEPCLSSPQKQEAIGWFGVRNDTGHGVPVNDDGVDAVLPPGYTAEQGKIGSQFKLPSGKCVTYPADPGYILLR